MVDGEKDYVDGYLDSFGESFDIDGKNHNWVFIDDNFYFRKFKK
jgi:hypothetical protein